MNAPWLSDFYSVPIPPLLSREAFVSKYLPQYAGNYNGPRRAPGGIKLNKSGRVVMSTPGSFKAQVSKRENRIAEAYSRYCRHHAEAVEMDRQAMEPKLL